MKIIKTVFLLYCLTLSLFLTLSAPFPLQIVFLPAILFIAATAAGKRAGILGFLKSKLFLYYNFVILTIVVATGFFDIKSTADLVSALIFAPLALFFGLKIIPKKQKVLILPEIISPNTPISKSVAHQKHPSPISKTQPQKLKAEKMIDDFDDVEAKQQFDKNRRVFIKLIGSAGISLFVFSIFTKKAQAAFFGSVPGPGTVALKDISGNAIDPAQNQPTDGYKISEVDDSSPAYYGFINKDGAWFIMKEDSGVYRYIKGSSSFSTNWTGRAGLTYDYYHNVF